MNTKAPLEFINQDILGHLNDMVSEGRLNIYIENIEELEDTILSDETGCFANSSGEPHPGVFQKIKDLRSLREDLRKLNSLCPDNGLI